MKYNEIRNKIKDVLDVEFYREPIYDDKYIKTKVISFSNIIHTFFSGDEIPKERIPYECISCISTDSVLKIENRYYPQVYLEQCKYKIKKRELKNFIPDNYELNRSSEDSDLDDYEQL